MRFTGLASVLSMVLGVSLGGIAHGGDCGCTAAARGRGVLRPAVRDEEGLCSGNGYGRADLHRDGVRSGNPHVARSPAAKWFPSRRRFPARIRSWFPKCESGWRPTAWPCR